MRPAIAVQVDHKWADRFEMGEKGMAPAAVEAEFGRDWPDVGDDLGKATVFDGSYGRGAAGWIPVLEWTFDMATKGLAWTVVLELGKRFRDAIAAARQGSGSSAGSDFRVFVSRGLAVILASAHVYEQTEEKEELQLEVVQEPTILSGNEPSEISYTGLEPWIVVLVNKSLSKRYVLAVGPAGEIHGEFSIPFGEFEAMFYRPRPSA